jgi:DNA-directed RNA polymerase specialized sigma24 family protein
MDCGSSVDDALYTSSPSPDESRLIALVKQHYFPLLSYARRRYAAAGAAEHVVSQTFAFAREHIDDVPDGNETFPWLLRVTRRHMVSRRRTDALRLRLLDQLRLRGGDPAPRAVLDHPSGTVYVPDPAHDESIEDWPPRQSGRLAGGPAGLPIAAVTPVAGWRPDG